MKSFKVFRLRILDLEIDEQKLYAWSSTSSGRRWFAQNNLQVLFQARDLGGQMNYSHKKYVQIQVGRLNSVHTQLKKLRSSTSSIAQKKLCIAGAILPRGLHACENILIANGHIDKLRIAINKSLRWDRAGASCLVRIGLLHTRQLDPGFYQFWHCLQMLRRQCVQHDFICARWRVYCEQHATTYSFGPFGKLMAELARVSWYLSPNLQLTTHESIELPFLEIPTGLLHQLALEAWQHSIALRVSERRELHDLVGFNGALLKAIDAKLPPDQIESLAVIRDGSFFTSDFVGKFDPSKPFLCSRCDCPDTREHRYRFCPKYSSVRDQFPDLIACWDSLPISMRTFGLPGALETGPPFRKALLELASAPVKWHLKCQLTGVLHLFTDGSCNHGKYATIALASWSIVSPTLGGCVAAGGLPGLAQTIPRAETWALLKCLEWTSNFSGTLHLWLDSQLTVDGFRLLQTTDCGPEGELDDLWQTIASKYFEHGAEIFVHKVPSHQRPTDASGPLEEWCAQWNNAADTAARVANVNRPQPLDKLHKAHVEAWDSQYTQMQQLTALHLGVAAIDFAKKIPQDGVREPEGEEEYFPRTVPVDMWYTEQTEQCSLNWLFDLSQRLEFNLAALTGLHEWLLRVEENADFVCEVTLIEIYVAWRIENGGSFSKLLGLPVNPFIQQTFAADFAWFKKYITVLFSALGETPSYIRICIPDIGIMCGQVALPFAWRSDLGLIVQQSLRRFIGNRPIQNHQGFAKPWHVTC